MTPDPRTEAVTARVVFTGVMLMCINKDTRGEVGLITCPKHTPTITIIHVDSDVPSASYDLAWSADHDLIFKVNNPEVEGVGPHPSGSGDTDFNKIIDLEGPVMHNSEVDVNTSLLDGRRLGFTSGKVYAHKLTQDELDLLTWTDPKDPGTLVRKIGKIAEDVGLNIACRNEQGSGIDIVDAFTRETITSLPAQANRSYLIKINNDCRVEDEPAPDENEDDELELALPTPKVGTDFRTYYDVINSRDGQKFDLAVSVGASPPTPFPHICELGFLSRKKTIGLVWPQL